MTDQALKAAVERVTGALDSSASMDYNPNVTVKYLDLRTLLAALPSQASVMEEMARALRPFSDGAETRDLTDSILAGVAHIHGDHLNAARTALSHYRTLGDRHDD